MEKKPYVKPIVTARKVTLGVYGNYGKADDEVIPGRRAGDVLPHQK